MRIAYERKNFRPDTLAVIEKANQIIAAYERDGMALTLRQLYYRFIAGDFFPESWRDPRSGSKNVQKNYKRLGSICGNARMAGLMSWRAIEDRTRALKARAHWESPADIVEACAHQYSLNRWAGQPHYVECWFEKDALAGVFQRPCTTLDIPFFSCRGYGSLSELWGAGRRLRHYAMEGQKPVILHFGDHDPSGMDMTRDIRDRLSLFAGRPVRVERIALNFDQVEEYDPPPNPAKTTDSRYETYVEEYGDESWELDALEPRVLRELVEEHAEMWLDRALYDEKIEEEKAARRLLKSISKRWAEVEDQFGGDLEDEEDDDEDWLDDDED